MIPQLNGTTIKKKNEYLQVANNIVLTTAWINNQEKKVLENSGLTLQQKNILHILEEHGGPLSTLQIRERLPDNMSDTSRIVDRLILKGLVKKVVNSSDKRLVDVSITNKGQKLLSKVGKNGNQIEGLLKILSQSEAKALNKYLAKIRESNE
ncbi:MAG: MarR family winged helix-turn-helix transcriptional regulator [Chitinophagaceae bacterium]